LWQAYLPNIADSEVLNEVSQIVLKVDFVFAIGTPWHAFSLVSCQQIPRGVEESSESLFSGVAAESPQIRNHLNLIFRGGVTARECQPAVTRMASLTRPMATPRAPPFNLESGSKLNPTERARAMTQ
jgi:hypothetical protein